MGGSEGIRIGHCLSKISENEVYVSVVSYEEQVRGLLAKLATSGNISSKIPWYNRIERLLEFYSETPLLSFDEIVVEQFQELWVQRIRIGTMDLKIAATALAHNATLLTRNTQDFSRVPNLRIEDWSVASE